MSRAIPDGIETSVDRRNLILSSAVRTLSNHGFRGATTRRIAGDAGVSEALLYKHFLSKEALLDAVLDHLVATFQSTPRAIQLEQMELSDREFLIRFAGELLEKARRNPEEVRILFYAGLQGHRLAAEYYKRQVKSLLALVAKRIERGQQAGVYRDVSSGIAASCYLSMLRSQVLKLVIFGKIDRTVDESDWPEQFVEIFIRGISL